MSLKKTKENGDRLPISGAILNSILKNILERRFTEAGRAIDQMESKIKEEGYSDFARGFIYALRGIILMYRTGNQSTFISRLDLNDVNLLRKYYREFSEHAENKLHGDYDRGYFSALAKFIFFALKKAEKSKNSVASGVS